MPPRPRPGGLRCRGRRRVGRSRKLAQTSVSPQWHSSGRCSWRLAARGAGWAGASWPPSRLTKRRRSGPRSASPRAPTRGTSRKRWATRSWRRTCGRSSPGCPCPARGWRNPPRRSGPRPTLSAPGQQGGSGDVLPPVCDGTPTRARTAPTSTPPPRILSSAAARMPASSGRRRGPWARRAPSWCARAWCGRGRAPTGPRSRGRRGRAQPPANCWSGIQ